ncbi:MAG: hypothetical protein ACFFCS_05275 [Candidatus Hodarchaeota archaeon]
MPQKSSIAVSSDLRKKIKKLAAILDKPQGEIVSEAIEKFEEEIISRHKKSSNGEEKEFSSDEFDEILDAATRHVWETDPESKEIQEKLESGDETIDDFITNKWETGLKM